MMGSKNEIPFIPLTEARGLTSMTPVPAQGPAGPVVAADRLYQLATLTAGIFLLVTLL